MISANGQTWRAYRANASPAQAVQHALLELIDRHPALVVSGINYGENIGVAVTVSGTVGAALEAAAFGVPALAVSLQTDPAHHMTNDASVDFRVAAYFTRLFAARWLNTEPLPDVDVLKIDIPQDATPDTPWRITRLERRNYYRPLRPARSTLDGEGHIGYELNPDLTDDQDSDASVLLRDDLGHAADPGLHVADRPGRAPPHPGPRGRGSLSAATRQRAENRYGRVGRQPGNAAQRRLGRLDAQYRRADPGAAELSAAGAQHRPRSSSGSSAACWGRMSSCAAWRFR